MTIGTTADDEESSIIQDVCAHCWCSIIFYNEESSDLDKILGNPNLVCRIQELYANRDSVDQPCSLCNSLVLSDIFVSNDDIYLVDNEGYRSAVADGCLLEDVFERLVDIECDINNREHTKPGMLVKAFGFNICVLAVFLKYNIGTNDQVINSFAKRCIKIELDESAKQRVNELSNVFDMVKSRIESSVTNIENSSDEVIQLIQSYLSYSQVNKKAVNYIDAYSRRLLSLTATKLQQECMKSCILDSPLTQRLMQIYVDDRHLFEQLLRINLNVKIVHEDTLRISEFVIIRDVITFVGYYNKLARGLCQTSWTPGKETKSNLSVEECLCLPLMSICDGSSYKFMASGREDCDVRTIGNGRMFCVELYNCKRDLFDVYRLIHGLHQGAQLPNDMPHCYMSDLKGILHDIKVGANRINQYYFAMLSDKDTAKSPSKMITISPISRETLSQAFDAKNDGRPQSVTGTGFYGLKVSFNSRLQRQIVQTDAENKCKTYSCLIYSDGAVDLAIFHKLPQGPFSISQENPVRTSHRKGQCKRTREIYYMHVDPIHPRLFHLTIKTQAGESSRSLLSS
uniref:tRNA pseudouridine(55) synthase n=1 Tax=Babesia bovis TaxID=5865 RepID=A7AWF8_BABBO|eukprot:XP_001608954.1 hypothetical protein [Babesia bovis T2Bo]